MRDVCAMVKRIRTRMLKIILLSKKGPQKNRLIGGGTQDTDFYKGFSKGDVPIFPEIKKRTLIKQNEKLPPATLINVIQF